MATDKTMNSVYVKDNEIIAEKEFSSALRATHWIRFFVMIGLIATGFYLAYVFIQPTLSDEPVLFLQAKIRMWHLIFGFILIGATITKAYFFFFGKSSVDKKELISFKDIFSIRIWIDQIKFYLFLGEHPKIRGVYNPLQFVTYLIIYVCLLLFILTGLILYIHVYHEGLGGALYGILRPIEAMFGSLANVRIFHHILMWVILIFVPIHVYMVIFNSIKSKDGSVDAIISGLKFKKEDH